MTNEVQPWPVFSDLYICSTQPDNWVRISRLKNNNSLRFFQTEDQFLRLSKSYLQLPSILISHIYFGQSEDKNKAEGGSSPNNQLNILEDFKTSMYEKIYIF